VWATTYARWVAQLLAKMSLGRASKAAQDWALEKDAQRLKTGILIWGDDAAPSGNLRVAE